MHIAQWQKKEDYSRILLGMLPHLYRIPRRTLFYIITLQNISFLDWTLSESTDHNTWKLAHKKIKAHVHMNRTYMRFCILRSFLICLFVCFLYLFVLSVAIGYEDWSIHTFSKGIAAIIWIHSHMLPYIWIFSSELRQHSRFSDAMDCLDPGDDKGDSASESEPLLVLFIKRLFNLFHTQIRRQ